MQIEPEDNHEHEGSNRRYAEPEGVSAVQPVIEQASAKQPKGGYFNKFKNWISFATLLFLAAYTVITGLMWQTSQDQLVVIRDQERKQLRAYLTITGSTVVQFEIGKAIRFQNTFYNFGQTPAYHVTILGRSEFQNTTSTPVFDVHIADYSTVKVENEIVAYPGKHAPAFQRGPDLTQENQANFQNQIQVLVYYGTLFYEDAFGDPHISNFCWVFGPQEIAGGVAVECKNHHEAN
jgi:hypothetical protein